MDLAFDIMFYESQVDAYKRYAENIKRFIAFILQINKTMISLQEKKEEHLYRGELCSNRFRFVGQVRIDDSKLLRLITEYCNQRALDNSLIGFNSSVFNDFNLLKTRLRSMNIRQLHSLGFGTLVKLRQFVPHIKLVNKNISKFNKPNIGCDSIQANFEHYKKHLIIEVRTPTHYRFILDYAAVNYIVISKIDDFWTIFLVLLAPPLLYEVERVDASRKIPGRLMEESLNEDEDEPEDVQAEDTKVRITKVFRQLRKVKLSGNSAPTVFTKSNVLELCPLTRRTTQAQNYFKQIWAVVSNINRFSKVPVYIGKIEQFCESLGDVTLPIPTNLPFNVHYAYQCLENVSFQLHDELFTTKNADHFLEKVRFLSALSEKATEEALYDLFWIKDNNIPVDSFYALESRFTERLKSVAFQTNYPNLIELKRCILTPTRIIFLPPLIYRKSRLLRMCDPEYSLIVYAKDDNFNELNFTVLLPGRADHCEDFLRQHVMSKWILGIRLKERNYEYLGSSSSQLREMGMMFYADVNGISASKVRKSVGDLEHIKSPAKYIARLGQAFSQSIAHLQHIDSAYVTVEPDVTGGINPLSGKPYVFSDGVGMLSEKLAMILTDLVDKDRLKPYSAFQIRHGGSKGMVALNPDLPGIRMILRDSMKKFESSLTSIEVVKVSKPRCVYLNRPFVNILEQLGVDSRVFLKLSRQNLQRIIDTFSCKCKALEVIENLSYLKMNFDALKNCDINIFGELFFHRILESVIKNTLKVVKSKARIKIPESYGRTMFGVMDETMILEEGQVFIQYSMFEDFTERKVVTGEVLVTKFPCMHPGDVRKFTAVDIPQLHHICDCIVFPQVGSRPHPDQMAGSDLDGDEYAVIWEKSFIFPGPNKDAMNYPSGTVGKGVFQVGVADMLQFYVDFIQKNNVGPIGSAHLALSDQREKGIFDEDCITLAKQYPIALDFAKSGELDSQKSPRAEFYPDFMEKIETNPTYKSKRALGKLFRLTCLFEENAEFESVLEDQLLGNEDLLTYPGWKRYEMDANDAYIKYKSRILHIQRQFGIDDELSLLSGVSTKIQKFVLNKQECNDVHQMVNLLVSGVKDEMKSMFEMGINSDERNKLAKASAWYLVTRQLNEKTENPYYGLPWILTDILCEIAVYNSNRGDFYHICNLNHYVYADGQIQLMDIQQIETILKKWLSNNLRSFRSFQYFSGNVDEKYQKIILPFVRRLPVITRLDVAIQRVLTELSVSLESDNEFDNMLALSASMTLQRFRRTKNFDAFTQYLNQRDTEKDTWVTCLSLKNDKFRNFVRRNEKQLFNKLKDSGIEDICCQITEHGDHDKNLLFISAYGTKYCLKKLRNVITRLEFYDEVVCNRSLSFY